MSRKLTETLSWEEIAEKIMNETGHNESKFKQWLMSKQNLGGYFFNSLTWRNCYSIYKKINNTDDDHIEVVSGTEGSGKSTIAIQKLCVVDPTFCRNRIFNNPLELFQWLQDNDGNTKGKGILLDEGNLFLFSRQAMTKGSINMVQLFTLMRQANLYVVICIPHFKTIDSYVREHRIDSLIRIKTKHKNFIYYSKPGIEIINIAMRKGLTFKEIRVKSGTFYNGYWNKFLPVLNDINIDKYKDIKKVAWQKFIGQTIDVLSLEHKKNDYITSKEAEKVLPLNRRTLYRYLQKGTLKGKKVGSKWFIDRKSLELSNEYVENAPKL